jgi:hypothetical protein
VRFTNVIVSSISASRSAFQLVNGNSSVRSLSVTASLSIINRTYRKSVNYFQSSNKISVDGVCESRVGAGLLPASMQAGARLSPRTRL